MSSRNRHNMFKSSPPHEGFGHIDDQRPLYSSDSDNNVLKDTTVRNRQRRGKRVERHVGNDKRGDSSDSDILKNTATRSRKASNIESGTPEGVNGDFDDHYGPPDYSQEEIQWAQNKSQEVFGKSWDELNSDDLARKSTELIRKANPRRRLSKEEKRNIDIDIDFKQYVLNIAIQEKNKGKYRQSYARTDIVTQNLADE
jgi:hypothetical protein